MPAIDPTIAIPASPAARLQASRHRVVAIGIVSSIAIRTIALAKCDRAPQRIGTALVAESRAHENACGKGALPMQRCERLPADAAAVRALVSAKRSHGWAGPDDPDRGQRHSEAGAAARAEAAVARPGCARLDVGDSTSAPGLLDRPFRATTIRILRRHGTYPGGGDLAGRLSLGHAERSSDRCRHRRRQQRFVCMRLPRRSSWFTMDGLPTATWSRGCESAEALRGAGSRLWWVAANVFHCFQRSGRRQTVVPGRRSFRSVDGAVPVVMRR